MTLQSRGSNVNQGEKYFLSNSSKQWLNVIKNIYLGYAKRNSWRRFVTFVQSVVTLQVVHQRYHLRVQVSFSYVGELYTNKRQTAVNIVKLLVHEDTFIK